VRLCGILVGVLLLLPASAWARSDGSPRSGRLAVPAELRVVSYYPADAGWTKMWEPWRPERIAADLRRLRGLNANTVRVIVPARFFGYPEPEQRRLDQLRELVGLAEGAGLHVHFTLFDWWGEYGDVAGSKRWARAVLGPYVGDPRLAFVELRNELDVENAAALAWARALVPWLRGFLRGQTPVTLSVGGMRPAADLRALAAALPERSRPDFFDAHYFTGGGERAHRVFEELRDIAAPTPLWIGELGYPTSSTLSGYEGVPLTQSAQEAAQEHFLKLCFGALSQLGLPAPGLWILDDFTPDAIPGSDVSAKEPEYTFGLFRADGTPKPAAGVVRRLFAGVRDAGFNGGFETAAAAEDGTAVPAVWGSTGGLRLVLDQAAARSGRAAALVAGPGGASGVFGVSPVEGAVERGRAAEVTAWIRGRGSVRVGITWFDRQLRPVGETSTLGRGGRDWMLVRAVGLPPRGAEFARIVVRADDPRGPVWLDDVAFAWLPAGDDVAGTAGEQRVEHVGRVHAA
jgi:hypothetical protein